MKTLLLRPFVDSTEGISPPLSIMYMSSFLKSKGLQVDLFDNCVDRIYMMTDSKKNRYVEKLCGDISKFNPDIIGITLFSREITDIAYICKMIKSRFKSIYIILGGPHPTVMPEETIKEIPDCDFVVVGEGELSFVNLINSISKQLPIEKVKGICFRESKTGKILKTERENELTNLDDIPFPDRESVIHNYKNNKYGSVIYGFPSDVIMTSRGCPFQCNFCFKVCNKYRSRSPENVIEEIKWIYKNISPQSILIMDDSFTIEKNRCSKILDYLISENIKCDFKVRSRVDAADEFLLKKMKRAGVTGVVYGFESGSQSMLNAFNKRATVEQNIRACELTKRAGIKCFGDMILFYPGENRQTLSETEAFVKIAKPAGIRFHILSPLPGTKVYEEALRSGAIIGGWGIGKAAPWIRLKDFDNLDEMERIARKLFIKTSLNFTLISSLFIILLKNFYKNPMLFIKVMAYAVFKKRKY